MLYIPANYYESIFTKTQIRIWEKDVDIHVNKTDRLDTNISKMFSLIILKFKEAFKDRLQALSTFQGIKDVNDAIGFLHAIK